MSITKGIKIIKDSKGNINSVAFSMRHHKEMLQDYLDLLEAQKRKDEPTKQWDEVKAKLDKKHGIK